MEKEINQNKKKIKIKASTRENKVFLLKKEFIYEETEDRVIIREVEFMEHGKNTAIYRR